MVRLRNAVMVFALAGGLAGCSAPHNWNIAHISIWHCDSCDDFPSPSNGPNYSMIPGTYTGGPVPGTSDTAAPAGSTPATGGTPAMAPAAPAITPAPAAPATTPPTPPSPPNS